MKKWPRELENILRNRGFSGFQTAVYLAVLEIPAGSFTTYSRIAKRIKRPRSARAAANALAKNPLPVVIPCHRVIRQDGAIGGYKWGEGLKKKLLKLESLLSASGADREDKMRK